MIIRLIAVVFLLLLAACAGFGNAETSGCAPTACASSDEAEESGCVPRRGMGVLGPRCD